MGQNYQNFLLVPTPDTYKENNVGVRVKSPRFKDLSNDFITEIMMILRKFSPLLLTLKKEGKSCYKISVLFSHRLKEEVAK